MAPSKDEIKLEKLRARLIDHAFFLRSREGVKLKLYREQFNRLIAQDIVLDQAQIERCAFTHSNFAGARFRNAELSDSEFVHCGLFGCDFRNAQMRGVRITYSDGGNAKLGGLKIQDKPFAFQLSDGSDPNQDLNAWTVTDLSNSNFSGADLTGASLPGAIMREVNLTGAVLTKADLRGADLSGACLRDADFTYAEIDGIKLDGAIFSTDVKTQTKFGKLEAFRKFQAVNQSIMATITRHEFWVSTNGREGRQANFKGQALSGLDLSGRKLAALDFSGAIINGSTFDNAVLAASNFRGAQITNSSFNGADCRAVDFADVQAKFSAFLRADFGKLVVDGHSVQLSPNFVGAQFLRCEFEDNRWAPLALEDANFTNCDGLLPVDG